VCKRSKRRREEEKEEEEESGQRIVKINEQNAI